MLRGSEMSCWNLSHQMEFVDTSNECDRHKRTHVNTFLINLLFLYREFDQNDLKPACMILAVVQLTSVEQRFCPNNNKKRFT